MPYETLVRILGETCYICAAKCPSLTTTMAGLKKVEYITSQRGSIQVFFDNYLFNRNKTTTTTTAHWRCVVKTCIGKCTTVGDYVRNSTEHNHLPPDSTRLKFVSSMRKRAREEPTTAMPALYQDELLKYHQEDASHLPSYSTLDSALYRHRSHTIPRLPQTLVDVNLDGVWTQTLDSERFLLFSDGDDDKIVVFATDAHLQALQSASTIYMDGTFAASPDLWDQLYIIHARVGTSSYPLVYALMPSWTIAAA
ncbi:uncharacterized protein [Haliotis asinina]|uniref:uncharacterized protein n=1 Tax=Haliotis asinina TaxID=109174 RepID=UPI00353209CA